MNEKRKGEVLIFTEGFIWAFFPIVTVLSYAQLQPLASLAWSNIFAALFFGVMLLYRGNLRELNNVMVWKYVFGIVVLIGVVFYGLFFTGLTGTTAGNASIVAQFEIFTSFFFFHILRREDISREHIVGCLLMVIGAAIVLFPKATGMQHGDLLILLATFVPPLGNYFQQQARKIASSETILFLRSALSIPLLFALGYGLEQTASLVQVKDSLAFLVINGVVIFGLSKLLWLESIHRIPVTKALALNSITPLLTILIAWPLLDQTPSGWQFASLIPLILGIFLLTDQLKLTKYSWNQAS